MVFLMGSFMSKIHLRLMGIRKAQNDKMINKTDYMTFTIVKQSTKVWALSKETQQSRTNNVNIIFIYVSAGKRCVGVPDDQIHRASGHGK